MVIRDMEGKVEDRIPVQNVLLSTSDKTGLDTLIPRILQLNPDVRFMSTGGTHAEAARILGARAGEHLIEVADYTGFPEMSGGLVKTLQGKIHAGILGERNNPEHERYLREDMKEGVFIDMVVANLYPFSDVVAETDTTFEQARGNIDIGGPAMMRAGAKNFPGCAVVSSPGQYRRVLNVLGENRGATTFDLRFSLAKETFKTTAAYEADIERFLLSDPRAESSEVPKGYEFSKTE